MINLAFDVLASPDPRPDLAPRIAAAKGAFGKLAAWLCYQRALHELRRLDDRDLDDIGIGRVDFPALAWRHATGAAPLLRVSQR
jgi:uncharacterized protein YjiS (DUF1127 family)